jgi:2,4-dienoyl-CoA reductase (NADPH2)
MAAFPRPERAGMLVDARAVAFGKVTPGRKVVVVGGGKIGLTLAESLKSSGTDVAVVEADKRIAGDVMPTWKWRHSAWIDELEIPTYTGSRLTQIGGDSVTIVDGAGRERRIEADMVVAAAPSRANQELISQLEWSIDELHGCGDAMAPRGLTQAIHDGYRLGCRI